MLAALYLFAVLLLSVYGVQAGWLAIQRLRADRAPDESIPPAPEEWPSVTVQLPVFNEPAVIERLIDACARLDYPSDQLQIQVLDDSTDITSALASARVEAWKQRGVNITHIRRRQRDGFKAGALAYGLEKAEGTFVAIFDADFLPKRDFLKRTIPCFGNQEVGVVQGRWSHINDNKSWLTGAQAIGLDTHFAVEQAGRQISGWFGNFNGTGGVWRRRCIEDAGGWQSDTLTEDLDLSYRAQVAGWQLRYVESVTVPAELPGSMQALRTQQARWARGAIETSQKLLPKLWGSSHRLGRKVAGSLHLTGHLAFPALLLVALVHAPAVALSAGGSVAQFYLAISSIGFVGFAGFFLAQVTSQWVLHSNWARRMARFPVFLIGTIGLSLSNTRAIFEAISGEPAVFERTPKEGAGTSSSVHTRQPEVRTRICAFEVLLAVIGWVGVGLLLITDNWIAVPFQAALAGGFTAVIMQDILDRPAAAYYSSESALQAESAVG